MMNNESKISLSRKWSFRLDPNDIGLSEEWHHKKNQEFNQSINVPGAWQARELKTTNIALSHHRAKVFLPFNWKKLRIEVLAGTVNNLEYPKNGVTNRLGWLWTVHTR